MSDLRKIFESKDFVINSNIVKSISTIDITLDEFLLVLYFINISCYLDTENIKDKLGFDDEKTYNTFSSLLNKKYIEIEVTNNNNSGVLEKVKLEPLYDRLALNKKIETNETDLYSLFERELGRTLSSFEYELINKWIEDGVSENTIKEALKDQNISVLRVIHGYHSDILMKMVRKEFRTHPRVDHIELSMNKGLTDLVIKKANYIKIK